MEFLPVIHSNIMTLIRTLILEAPNLGTYESIEDQGALTLFNNLDDNAFKDRAFSTETGVALKTLWNDPGVQKTWDQRANIHHIVETIKQLADDIDRIGAEDYCPTEQDILLSRVRTTGIITEEYDIDGTIFEMYDVGGQRNERKKWIHCFENVTAVIFVAALSEYNQKLLEDAACNRMIEALDLFQEIASSPFFLKSSLLLFLNKKDLFESKIAKVPINDTEMFADYKGGADYDAGVAYFVKQFKDRFAAHGGDRELYHHCTCATDTQNVKVVFNICKNIILQNALKESGFM